MTVSPRGCQPSLELLGDASPRPPVEAAVPGPAALAAAQVVTHVRRVKFREVVALSGGTVQPFVQAGLAGRDAAANAELAVLAHPLALAALSAIILGPEAS